MWVFPKRVRLIIHRPILCACLCTFHKIMQLRVHEGIYLCAPLKLQHKLNGHFIRYTLRVPGWIPFCFQNCLNSSWHRFNNMRSFHDETLPFQHIPNVHYWIEIWLLRRPFVYSEQIVMFKRPVGDDLSFLTWCIIRQEVAIRR